MDRRRDRRPGCTGCRRLRPGSLHGRRCRGVDRALQAAGGWSIPREWLPARTPSAEHFAERQRLRLGASVAVDNACCELIGEGLGGELCVVRVTATGEGAQHLFGVEVGEEASDERTVLATKIVFEDHVAEFVEDDLLPVP